LEAKATAVRGRPGDLGTLTLSPPNFTPADFLFGAIPEFIGSAFRKTRILCE
jgi:hypothetical protein